MGHTWRLHELKSKVLVHGHVLGIMGLQIAFCACPVKIRQHGLQKLCGDAFALIKRVYCKIVEIPSVVVSVPAVDAFAQERIADDSWEMTP